MVKKNDVKIGILDSRACPLVEKAVWPGEEDRAGCRCRARCDIESLRARDLVLPMRPVCAPSRDSGGALCMDCARWGGAKMQDLILGETRPLADSQAAERMF